MVERKTIRNALSRIIMLASSIVLVACGGGTEGNTSISRQEPVARGVSGTSAESLPSPHSISSISQKIIVGYQGWFGCPGDFEDNTDWIHWFNGPADPQRFTVDALPALSDLNPSDLCQTGLLRKDGSPLFLFSSQNKNVVHAHFQWMKQNNVDVAAAQRFISEAVVPKLRRRSDNVLRNIRSAAEANDRAFYITYDVSGADPATVVENIRNDWRYLVEELQITNSPSYLREKGKPLLQIWGFGFNDRPGTPEAVLALLTDLKNGQHGLAAATVIGGVPSQWRTLSGDSKSDPRWSDVYHSYDVISPWTVGRYTDLESWKAYVAHTVIADMKEAAARGITYLPVVFPGFSWGNLMTNRGNTDQAILNQIPRNCGNFLWSQITDLTALQSNAFYAAMFDEVDEGTALFKIEPKQDRIAVNASMIALDQDGCIVPDDWYLSILGKASSFIKAKQLPPKELALVMQP